MIHAPEVPGKSMLCAAVASCCLLQKPACAILRDHCTCAECSTSGLLTSRRISEQRAEAAQLQEQVAQLQSDLAASHAAHLALQQHHTASMEAAAQEKQQLEEQHRLTVETLQQVRLTSLAPPCQCTGVIVTDRRILL
jgi:hypothetical protein